MQNQQLMIFHTFDIFDDKSLVFYSEYPFTIKLNSDLDLKGLEVCNGEYYRKYTPKESISSGSKDGYYYVKFRGSNIKTYANSETEYSNFVITNNSTDIDPKYVQCKGNILNLLNYKNTSNIILSDYSFYKLFENCDRLNTAPELPSMVLSNYCYAYMFNGCGLKNTPELPSTNLAEGCYMNMFSNCSNIRVPSKLEATVLPSKCYKNMFYGCNNIKISLGQIYSNKYQIPYKGISTNYSSDSLEGMFTGSDGGNTEYGNVTTPSVNTQYTYYYISENCLQCSNILDNNFTFSISNQYFSHNVEDPSWVTENTNTINENIKIEYSFDGETWKEYTYNTEITSEGSELYLRGVNNDGLGPVGTINFKNAKISLLGNLKNLINYSNTEIQYSQYLFAGLFKDNTCLYDISNLELPKEYGESINNCFCNTYDSTFYGCTNLTNIVSKFPGSTKYLPGKSRAAKYVCMFYGCTSIKNIENNIFTDYNADYFMYYYMFAECTSLYSITNCTAIGVNSADIEISTHCYSNMFSGCTSLSSAPALPATSLASYCYSWMFSGCTSLSSAPALPATSLAQYCYSGMFSGCTNLSSAPALPSRSLARSCYIYMFSGCTNLSSAPALPATSLAQGCYSYMFSECTSLSSAPALPATILAKSCYSYMFCECTNLVSTSALPAKELAYTCYYGMFSNCTSLTLAPELPATELADYCYCSMFNRCTSLSSAPELPATTLAQYCYANMFYNCTSLSSAPALPATSLASYCYKNMFYGCTSLSSAPKLPATTLADYCYWNMFYGCTSIKLSTTKTDEYNTEYRIPTNNTGTTGTNSLTNMFAYTGGTFTGTPTINTIYYIKVINAVKIQSTSNTSFTFTSNSSANLEYSLNDIAYSTVTKGVAITASDGILYLRGTGNTTIGGSNSAKYFDINCSSNDIKISGNILNLLDYTNNPTSMDDYVFAYLFCNQTCIFDCSKLILPEFVSRNCYYYMFYGCTSLTSTPALPATSLVWWCYHSMFYGCTSLTSAPELPATSLANCCYYFMFCRCKNLSSVPVLPATSLATGCYKGMFLGCTNLTSVPALPATTLANDCYSNMFQGCTNLTSAPALPATSLFSNCYYYMFYRCTNIKLSTTKTDEYNIKYRIPSSGTGTTASNALTDMFTNTGGTFTGTPSINTTYYTLNNALLLVIESNSNTSFTFTSNSSAAIEYSLDNSSYSNITKGTAITASDGILYLRGTGNTTIGGSNSTKYFDINCSSNDIKISGNILNLLDYKNNPTSMGEYAFSHLFYNNTCISDCSDLILPEFTSSQCYQSMFYGCTSLTSAPALPATTLANNCYSNMFYGCTSLTSAPALPATTLAEYCYSYMFQECTSLTSAPELPATELAEYCYYQMFYGCTSLTSAPELPATELAEGCYSWMFCRCTSIKLNTTKTIEYNTEYRIPSSDTGTTNTNSLFNMFDSTGGTFTGTPEINTTYYQYDYSISQLYIKIYSPSNNTFNISFNFENNTDNSIEILYTASSFTINNTVTISNISEIYIRGTGNGAFGKNKLTKPTISITGNATDVKIVGNILNLLDYKNNPTSMDEYAFAYLFYNSTSIHDCSELILPEFTNTGCYYYMFSGCTNLAIPPKLPAREVTSYCYSNMFSNCTNLYLSTTNTSNYSEEYNIPSVKLNFITTSTSSFTDMFTNTGGTFTGTPTPNLSAGSNIITYYLDTTH